MKSVLFFDKQMLNGVLSFWTEPSIVDCGEPNHQEGEQDSIENSEVREPVLCIQMKNMFEKKT